MSAKTAFKAYLKKIFKKAEGSLEKACKELKVDAVELGEWLDGKHVFSMQEAIKLGKVTDTDPAELIYLQKAVEKEAAQPKAAKPKKKEVANPRAASGHAHGPAIMPDHGSERSICR